MTPCEKLGYKVGDRFEANGSSVFCDGTILTLVKDDYSAIPLFEVVDSRHDRKGREGYCSLENVTKISHTKTQLRPGDYVSTEGMTEEQYHAVAKAFMEAGAKPYGLDGKRKRWNYVAWDSEGDFIGTNGNCGECKRKLTIEQVLGEEDKPQKIRDVFLGDGPLQGRDSFRHPPGWTSLCADEEQPTIQSLLKKADKHARKAQKHEARRQEAIEQARAMLPGGWELTETGVDDGHQSDINSILETISEETGFSRSFLTGHGRHTGGDLNDPANWREGDVLTVVSKEVGDVVDIGRKYKLMKQRTDGLKRLHVPGSDTIDGGWTMKDDELRFHHRP